MNSDNLSVIIGIFVIVTPIALLIWLAIYVNRKQRMKAWENYLLIADALNMTVITPDVLQMRGTIPSVSGKSKGRDFSLFQEIKGSGKSRTYYTTFRWNMSLTEANTIMLYKENFFTRLGSIVGLKDVQTGFEGFDKKFILISSNQDLAQKLFSNEICHMFEDVHDCFRATINLNNNRIEYSEQGIITNVANRERLLKIILASRLLADKAEKGH